MERYYAKTVNLRGWPTCHFVMDTHTWGAVAIRKTKTRANSAAKAMNGGK